jgi:uncharacterized protein YcfJ
LLRKNCHCPVFAHMYCWCFDMGATMILRRISLFAAVISVFSLAFAPLEPVSAQTAPATTCKKQGAQVAGALLGALAGGFLGNRIDGGKNRTVGTVAGAMAGAFVGATLAKKLDNCEQKKVETATIAAADGKAGQAQAWTSDSRSDVHGTVTPSAMRTNPDGRQCRTITRVSYVAGEEVRDEPLVCRVPPATAWAPA